MKRVAIAILASSLAVSSAFASPQTDAAVKLFKAIGSDPAKLKVFCEMTKTMNSAGDKDDAAADAKIDGYMKQLGADFQKAWGLGEGIDEKSADGKAYNAAVDELSGKCS
ncbi:MAG: hypothetical protein JSS20_11455 [Proteobacteria bacterium]|nr:hypothetical protein [Pseudomonadota bacterium]